MVLAVPGPPCAHVPLTALAALLEQAGLAVDLIFLEEASGDALAQACRGTDSPLVVGGFSRGAKLAAALAMPCPLLCLGYPFHTRGKPKEQQGLTLLQQVTQPTLVVQGKRDAHGTWEEFRSYPPLPAHIQMHWLEDGNHRYQPRARSGVSEQYLLRSACTAITQFAQAHA